MSPPTLDPLRDGPGTPAGCFVPGCDRQGCYTLSIAPRLLFEITGLKLCDYHVGQLLEEASELDRLRILLAETPPSASRIRACVVDFCTRVVAEERADRDSSWTA